MVGLGGRNEGEIWYCCPLCVFLFLIRVGVVGLSVVLLLLESIVLFGVMALFTVFFLTFLAGFIVGT